MSGHLLLRLWCRLVGHGERIWTVTARGGGWTCVRCLQWAPSVLRGPTAVTSRPTPPTTRAVTRALPPARDIRPWPDATLAARVRAITLVLETGQPSTAQRQALRAERRRLNQERLRRAVVGARAAGGAA